MRLLLDTHALVWWLNESPKLSGPARAAITDPANSVFVSAATAWELATKVRLGRFPEARKLIEEFHELLTAEEFETLEVTTHHGLYAGRIAGDRSDPFDRMIAAQAMTGDLQVVTVDAAIATLGATTVW